MKDKNKVKPKRFAYLSALVDGDGSVSIRYNADSGYQLTLCVYSTSHSLMKYLVLHFGSTFREMPTEGNRKQRYQWFTSSPEIVLNVAAFSIIRKEAMEVAKRFLLLGSERNPAGRNDLMIDLQNANDRYLPVTEKFKIKPTVIPNKLDFCILAGLLDGEGSFSIWQRKKGNGRFTSAVRFSNTDAKVFPWLMTRFGGRFSPTKKEGKTEGTWTLSGPNRERFLLATIPYLVIKRERAILMLEWIRKNRNRRNTSFSLEQKQTFFEKMKKLNHRGLSPEANTSGLLIEDKIESNLRETQNESLVTAAL